MVSHRRLIATALLLSLVGCNSSTTESDNIGNDALWARMAVTDSEGDGRARVVVELNVGGSTGTNVELSDGESLEVTAGGITQVMEYDRDFLDVDYEAYLPVGSEQTLFTIDFYRRDEADARGSVVSLPSAFSITSPSVGDNLFSSTPLSIRWFPIGTGQIRATVSLSCLSATNATVSLTQDYLASDNGSLTVNFRTQFLDHMSGVDVSKACDADIRLVRSHSGVLASEFGEGGVIDASRARTVSDLPLTINDG